MLQIFFDDLVFGRGKGVNLTPFREQAKFPGCPKQPAFQSFPNTYLFRWWKKCWYLFAELLDFFQTAPGS